MALKIASPEKAWSGLGDAFQLDARITVFTRSDATIVPTGAMFRTSENWNVYVVRNGRAERQQVTLVRRSGGFAEVTAGVNLGDLVIVYPSDRITPDVRVVAR